MNYDSETFEDGEILLDGNSYVNCYFRRVKFIFTGILPVHLTNNKLIDCSWAFVGPAMETVSFMSGLYNGFESGRELIDRTFENIRMAQLANSEQPQISFKPTVFIGHGHSTDYLRLTVFLQNQDFKVETFESGPRAGMTAKEVLETMAARASIAFLVHTAEDEQEDGKIRARQNVVHETGLFQGRLGFKRAIVMREQGCADFSNLSGVQEIWYQKDQLPGSFNEVLSVIKREFPQAL